MIGLLIFTLLTVGLGSVIIGCQAVHDQPSGNHERVDVDMTQVNAEPPEFVYGDAQTSIPYFISEERLAIQARDLARLESLWAEDAKIIDARGTEDMNDDYVWKGRAAILDRYVLAVFPFPPPIVDPPTDFRFTCDGQGLDRVPMHHDKSASVEEIARENDVLDRIPTCLQNRPRNGVTVTATRGVDRWHFVFRRGRWWILELTYDFPQQLEVG